MSRVVYSPEHGEEETVERDDIILAESVGVVPLMDREWFEHGVGGKGKGGSDHQVDEEHMGSVLQNVDDADHNRSQRFTEKKPSEGFEKGETRSDGKYRGANIDDIIPR